VHSEASLRQGVRDIFFEARELGFFGCARVYLTNGVSGVRLVGLGGREPVAEGDSEGVDRWLPSHRPPDLALSGEPSGDV
jgi:hypothetical protein